jgi:hypothetical protein
MLYYRQTVDYGKTITLKPEEPRILTTGLGYFLFWYTLLMKKKSLIVLGVLVIVTLGVWYSTTHKAHLAPTSSIAGATLRTDGDFEYKKDTKFWAFDAVYPSRTPLSREADVRARTTMENWIVERTAEFEKNNNDLLDAEEQKRLEADGRTYATGISYKTYVSSSYISYVYQIYEDTGGAHPNAYYVTFTFNKEGKKVELADLFTPGARYLDALSAASFADIQKQVTARFGDAPNEDQIDWIRNGTSPSPEVFQAFYIDGVNLVIIFPPYQVAAYAAGVFETRIPLASLSQILR